MDLSHTPLNRLLCAEPLEGRWLLSGTAAATAAAPADTTAPVVDVLELEQEEDEGDDGDSEIAASQLPPAVLDVFRSRFPGAHITEAEVEDEDEGIQYGVTAEHAGRT